MRAVPTREAICHGFRNCCVCPACKQQEKLIAEHRAAGRYPFDHEGKVKPRPAAAEKRQPWETKRAA